MKCVGPDRTKGDLSTCDARVANNRWAKIKAGDAGWFFSRDGSAFCPAHVPDWVAEWRKRKALYDNADGT